MALRFALTFAALAIAIAVPVEYQHEPSHDAPAEYEFSYAVHDDHTGDIKSHKESRKGDVVQGIYELIDSDGFKRIVEYTADDHNGFNAIVRREPTDIKIPIFQSQQTHSSVHEYVHNVDNSAHIAFHAPIQHKYVAPKIVKPIAKVSPAVEVFEPVSESVPHKPLLKYVAPIVSKKEELNLDTHVTYTAPDFNYHY